MAQDKQSAGISLSTCYLILYNFFMFLGWSYVFVILFTHMVVEETNVGVWDAIRIPLYVFQTGAVLEILHAAVGIVRSNPVVTGVQVFSRVFLVWGICYSVPQVQDKVSVAMFLYAWSITEIIRYSFYTYGLLGFTPTILTWCRYTLFIVLYPIGVTGELLTIYWALPVLRDTAMYSYPMPNVVNMSFHYSTYCVLLMLSYIPVFPQLYLHMFAQRRKVIGGAEKKTA